MRKITSLFAAAVLTVLAVVSISPLPAQAQSAPAAQVVVEAGKMLYSSNGKILGAVYSVAKDGSAQVILEDQLVTIPVSTIPIENGKLVTSKTKVALLSAR